MFIKLIVYRQKDYSFAPLFCFCDEASYQTVGDGGSYPYFNQKIIGVFAGGLN